MALPVTEDDLERKLSDNSILWHQIFLYTCGLLKLLSHMFPVPFNSMLSQCIDLIENLSIGVKTRVSWDSVHTCNLEIISNVFSWYLEILIVYEAVSAVRTCGRLENKSRKTTLAPSKGPTHTILTDYGPKVFPPKRCEASDWSVTRHGFHTCSNVPTRKRSCHRDYPGTTMLHVIIILYGI